MRARCVYVNEVTIDDKRFQVGKHVLALVSNYKYVGMQIAVHASAQPRFSFRALNVSACETKCESKWRKYKKNTSFTHASSFHRTHAAIRWIRLDKICSRRVLIAAFTHSLHVPLHRCFFCRFYVRMISFFAIMKAKLFCIDMCQRITMSTCRFQVIFIIS